MEEIWIGLGGEFASIKPAVKQTFVAFYALHVYRSVEQRILSMSLVNV